MRALISVSDKKGIVKFAENLKNLGFEIISTGGTLKKLEDSGINAIPISDITNFPECLDGRVKTLHPAVHGGLLAKRDKKEHMEKLTELNIKTIDLVCINLYPFKETIKKENVSLSFAIENIDIGGPAMLRSAAKNHKDIIVLTNPSDYDNIISLLKNSTEVPYEEKYKLALKAFELTAAYDAMISEYLRKRKNYPLPANPSFTYEKIMDLRYGENPHQKASYYKEIIPPKDALVNARQLNGKELSFNNINDATGALACLREFDGIASVAVKHANPCGVGTADNIYDAYMKAYNGDPVSIFGGIVAFNTEVDEKTAKKLNEIFLEIVIAPSFSPKALEIIKEKLNLRILELDLKEKTANNNTDYDIKKIDGGILIQEQNTDNINAKTFNIVTDIAPTERQLKDMIFGMRLVKHIKSNGIALVKDGGSVGIGPGQTNRIGALEIAIRTSNLGVEGSVLASDAFFPFADCVELAAKNGIKAIVQPGGSVRDEESIKLANKFKIAMVFTGIRHFKH
ncbi:MAG: bifunctional phosphoribosylaminoimidazolecarboxamide formyltransferase/IMP cyclohydrolase [Clostridiales Family XIII bacterium]|jgi:phosphoribosylaminoimidazolecarboxamide formyltransferase/IMP cyclohydrolase|nr:bifunctional phosphoribosylaminoimidazolecarboxamide formyltransferase/IMP cyclohydrolase [Clostridiales Family XIII bacterium]